MEDNKGQELNSTPTTVFLLVSTQNECSSCPLSSSIKQVTLCYTQQQTMRTCCLQIAINDYCNSNRIASTIALDPIHTSIVSDYISLKHVEDLLQDK